MRRSRAITTIALSSLTVATGLAVQPALAGAATPAASTPADGPDEFEFSSGAGDYIGGGATVDYSSLTVTGSDSVAWLNAGGWTLDLAAPTGTQLQPGVYTGATRYPVTTGTAPGLSVFGNGRGCNNDYGTFTVYEVATDGQGHLTRLNATFEQHCESATAPALVGFVRFHATVPTPIPALPSSAGDLPPVTDPQTNANPAEFEFTSSPGDFIGAGGSYDATTVSANGSLGTVGVSSGPWTLQLSAPAGEQLRPGVYTGATRYPFNTGTAPGLSVYGNGKGCNNDYGTFTIYEIAANSDGALTRLNATFEQHCEIPGAPALVGYVRFNATLPTPIPQLPGSGPTSSPSSSPSSGPTSSPSTPPSTSPSTEPSGPTSGPTSLPSTPPSTSPSSPSSSPSSEPPTPTQPVVARVAGANRYDTGVKVSQQFWNTWSDPDKSGADARAVVLATGESFPDALSGGPLASMLTGPLLLTPHDALPAEVQAEIQRVLPPGGDVYVLGGTGAVSPAIQARLSGLGYQVHRLGGQDRFATSRLVAQEIYASYPPSSQRPVAVVATGRDFPDALAAGPLASLAGVPILLTNGTSVDPATAAMIDGKFVLPVGGPAYTATGTAPVDDGNPCDDLAGTDRYGTSSAVARCIEDIRGTFPYPSFLMGVATGANYPDALTGGAWLSLFGEPLLLTPSDSLDPRDASILAGAKGSLVMVELFGGTGALSPDVESGVVNVLGAVDVGSLPAGPQAKSLAADARAHAMHRFGTAVVPHSGAQRATVAG